MIQRDFSIPSAVALIAILIAGGMASGAATLKVCECKACGCQYFSIQEAIDIASPGDVVLVRSGTFSGNVNVTKPIVLRGEMWHGGDLPLINAQGNGSCITVNADGAVVDKMRVTNSGNLSGDAGIQVQSNNCTITSNIASGNGGSGIILVGARNCTLRGNTVSNNTVGILLTNSADNLVFNNRLYNNTDMDAFDDGVNLWNDGAIGNHYSSFNCTDLNNDTICDVIVNAVFAIPGGGSIDDLPLVV
ncbi:right-handed parallel beta-helix repeat-containing protein [Methanothrix harundinacea]|uniref:Periplasmic copper-binding protein n=1 Tax=Methanothrix harundinacea (strain 6Ac) TaxID=1110509 RepID=G7WP43_METH6|nr:NosD domain-containing protein [Methanothrix harundinacea]AET64884.1 Periplasmic copper-binding protein [Methanothrix harundinacea 6Ac]